jgi:hypothetical protein
MGYFKPPAHGARDCFDSTGVTGLSPRKMASPFKEKRKLSPPHATKTSRVSRSKAPLILNLETTEMSGKLHAPAVLPPAKERQLPHRIRKWVGPEVGPDFLENKYKFWP